MPAMTHAFPKIRHLERNQIAALQRIMANFQFIADLVHADLIMYCRSDDKPDFLLIVAETRPNTMISVQREVVAGDTVNASEEPLIFKTYLEQKGFIGEREFEIGAEVLDQQTIPIFDHIGRIIAVLSVERPKFYPGWRDIEILNRAARQLINCLAWETVYANRRFKPIAARDGIVIVNERGIVTYANPIASSIYKVMEVGNMVNRSIVGRHAVMRLMNRAFIEQVYQEQESHVDDLIYIERALPVIIGGQTQCLVLTISDVTEVRKKEKELQVKSAFIQEIHHRVKNNLQTIASLLRLQARRSTSPEVKEALQESINRILSISVVHEILSQQGSETINVVEVTRNIIDLILQSIVASDFKLSMEFHGEQVVLPSAQATSIALVITELVQNSVEHGFAGRTEGRIAICISEQQDCLLLSVEDDGAGLPANFSIAESHSLGLQIVRTLVAEDLKGSFEMTSDKGTKVLLRIPLSKKEDELDGNTAYYDS